MTLDQIQSLSRPEARPAGVTYTNYQELCFRAGVAEPMNKSAWESLPGGDNLAKGHSAKGYTVEDDDDKLEKMGDEEYGEDDEMGDGGEDSAAGDETEVAESDTDDDDDEGENMENAEKSVNVSDLMKAIDAYSSVEDALATPANASREDFLTARHDAGTISKSERAELGRMWSGTDDDDDYAAPLQKSLTETMHEDDNAGQLVDASDFLRTLVKGVDTRMEQVLGEVSRDGRATRELLKAQGGLIKSLAAHAYHQDALLKAQTDRLAHFENSPAPRRAVSSRPDSAREREFAKSGIAESGDNRLNKSQVTDGLRALMIHASESEDTGAMNRIAHATSLYEQTGEMSENIMTAVRQVS